MTGFIYPNEIHIEWDLLIVSYPYITGLVAGAFIVSSLYHVFGIKSLKPVARFSLVTALAFLIVAPMPLAIHLGRPERALEMFLRPNLISAMSGFGYIWFMYFLLVLAEVWLVFRADIVGFWKSSKGIKKTIYAVLALGVTDVSDKALGTDKKIIKVMAAIGIPAAILLHGYVGFIFGAIKSNAWWSTPLMPIIFLLSAIVSGIALLLVLYVLVTKIRKAVIDYNCVHSLALWLGGFLTVALTMEGLEILSMMYESEESWEAIRLLITEEILISYLVVQVIAGSLIPLLTLGSVELFHFSDRMKIILRVASSFLILVGVFAMRWNVVIGGQITSKSLRGFISYVPSLLGEGGLLITIIMMVLPFIILAVIVYFIPPWQEEKKPPEPKSLAFQNSR